jgi:hypothetical protein
MLNFFSTHFSQFIKEPRKQIIERQTLGTIRLEVDKLEKRDVQDLITLLEIMSNIHFFGGIKKTNCKHTKNGQCSLFYLQSDAKNKVPLSTECRIPRCGGNGDHCHLEVSSVTCTFCPQWNKNQPAVYPDKQNSSRRKNRRQEE